MANFDSDLQNVTDKLDNVTITEPTVVNDRAVDNRDALLALIKERKDKKKSCDFDTQF